MPHDVHTEGGLKNRSMCHSSTPREAGKLTRWHHTQMIRCCSLLPAVTVCLSFFCSPSSHPSLLEVEGCEIAHSEAFPSIPLPPVPPVDSQGALTTAAIIFSSSSGASPSPASSRGKADKVRWYIYEGKDTSADVFMCFEISFQRLVSVTGEIERRFPPLGDGLDGK